MSSGFATIEVLYAAIDGAVRRAFPPCSSVAQWQSIRLLTGGLLVRVQPEEPISSFAPIRKYVERLNVGGTKISAIGAIAGILIAPVVFLEPNMMLGVLLYGFAAAVLGGLTSPLGAVIGGFLVGIFENLAGTYIPGVGNELKLPIALALIITVLVFKPAGLFGRAIVKRV